MSTRFTENIDQLDEFYRQSFEDGGMEPPADMWDRVESSLDQNNKKKKGFFSKRNILISVVALLLLALIAWWMLLLTDKSIPNSDFPTPEKQSSKSTVSPSQKEDASQTKSELKKQYQSNKDNRNKAKQESSIEKPMENKTDSSTVIASDLKSAKPDSLKAAPEPKKRIRFRDKYKKMPADTIPLFIPE